MIREIVEIICDFVDVDPSDINCETSLRNDIGASSFDLMNIAVAIEDKYDISIPNAALPRIKTVGDVAELIAQRV